MNTRPISSKVSKRFPTVLPRLALRAMLCAALAAGLTACTDTADSANLETSSSANTPEEAPQLPTTMGDNGELDSTDVTADLGTREAEIARREELARREAELAAREAELARRERQARNNPPPRTAPAPAPAPVEDPGYASRHDDAPYEQETDVAQPEEAWEEAEPQVETVTTDLAPGTPIEVEFQQGVSSAASQPGETFSTRVLSDVIADGRVVIPAGSRIEGTVTEAKSLRKVGGKARLGLEFDQLVLPYGDRQTINAIFSEEGKSETTKDAATIGGAAVGGAVLGRETAGKKDRDRNTVIGAILGAAVGTAIAAKTDGQEVEIPAGTVVTVYLDDWTSVTHR